LGNIYFPVTLYLLAFKGVKIDSGTIASHFVVRLKNLIIRANKQAEPAATRCPRRPIVSLKGYFPGESNLERASEYRVAYSAFLIRL